VPKSLLPPKALAPSTECCLGILELLSRHPLGLTLSEIHRELGLSKNMVFRVLNDISARGYARRHESDKRYFVGKRLLELAVACVGEKNLVDEAAPEIRALRDQCGESVGLLVPSGGAAVLIYFQPSRQAIRTIYDLGIRIALYSNAPGKVFLAFGDRAECQQRLRLQSIERRTDRTITDPEALAEHLEQARRRGYTTDHAEDLEGVHCVAAPVFDAEESLVAAIVITGPSYRIPAEKLPEFGKMVAAVAARVTARLKS
jgi:DNA-binding IclR family transcriptional regulator